MLEGLYSAASGMLAQQRRLDSLANDISNVSTTGYKRVRTGFRDLLYQEAGRGAAQGTTIGSGAAASEIGRGWGQGAMRQTGRNLDIALTGPGFIQVKVSGGVALTRDGALNISNDGRLRTANGQYLQPPVRIPKGAEATIGQDGTVRADGRVVGRIAIVEVPNADGLRSIGQSLFEATADSGAISAVPRGDVQIAQGTLEGSNVDMGDAMVDMINAQRGFELASRAIKTQDEMLGVANGVKA